MKKIIATILVVGSFATSYGAALITKSSGGGFVMPEYGRTSHCEVFQDKVLISNKFGYGTTTSFDVVEERKITLSKDLKKVIEIAKTEQLVEKVNMLCDAPTTSIVAGDLLLFTSGGCGSPRKERTGFASSKLVELVNLYCPKTYDVNPN